MAELPFKVTGRCFTKFDDDVVNNPSASTLRSSSSSGSPAQSSANKPLKIADLALDNALLQTFSNAHRRCGESAKNV